MPRRRKPPSQTWRTFLDNHVKELASIVDYGKYGPPIDSDYFPNTVSSAYASSTTHANVTESMWMVFFSGGSNEPNDKLGPYYVRAVRGEIAVRAYVDNTTTLLRIYPQA